MNASCNGKGAVYAGFTTLLGAAGRDFGMVDRLIISGGFGQYLNVEKAVRIGLLPDIQRDKFAYRDEFTAALFLPHTNLEMFPTVSGTGDR